MEKPKPQEIEVTRKEWTELFEEVGSAGHFMEEMNEKGEFRCGMLLFGAKFIKFFPFKPESKDLHPARCVFVYCV